MRFIIFAILLAFPFLEIAILIQLGQRYGAWVIAYLLIVGYLGLKLIRTEKALISARMFQQLSGGGNPIASLFSTARNMLAGVLLLIPGVISDAIAVILLLLPLQQIAGQTRKRSGFQSRASANDDVIEGEFSQVDEVTSDQLTTHQANTHQPSTVDNVITLPKRPVPPHDPSSF